MDTDTQTHRPNEKQKEINWGTELSNREYIDLTIPLIPAVGSYVYMTSNKDNVQNPIVRELSGFQRIAIIY